MASPFGTHHHATVTVPPKHYHHVTIDGTGTKSYSDPGKYKLAVECQLKHIHHSHTGQILFQEFAHRKHQKMTIVPYEESALNAYASSADLRHATLAGHVERSGKNGQVLHNHGKTIKGLGGGSSSTIRFTPIIFTKYCNANKKGHKSGAARRGALPRNGPRRPRDAREMGPDPARPPLRHPGGILRHFACQHLRLGDRASYRHSLGPPRI